MPLTDKAIREIVPGEKPFKITDEKGLYLLVKRPGIYFHFDYNYNGSRKTISMGVYPDVSLEEARVKRDEARALLSEGVDPSEHKKAIRLRAKLKAEAMGNRKPIPVTYCQQEDCRIVHDVKGALLMDGDGKPLWEFPSQWTEEQILDALTFANKCFEIGHHQGEVAMSKKIRSVTITDD